MYLLTKGLNMNYQMLITASMCGTAVASFAAVKPNLVVIMTDDLGYADVGFNGCKDIPTPNIDTIAHNGVLFSNGYAAYSVCGPSRAGFITGRYQQRFGFERNPQYRHDDPNMGVPKSESMISEILNQVGYTSGIIGKWHLGCHKETHHPLSRGFDEFYGHLGGGHTYFAKLATIKDSYNLTKDNEELESYRTWILRNHSPEKFDKYLTDQFSDEGVAFIERHKKEPFFLFMSYNAPHTPLQASQKYLDRFKGIKDKKRRTYAAMVSAVDDGVGMILEKLRKEKIEDNTIIFFMSDNGGPESKNSSDNGLLRGSKSSTYEGGFRIPFAMQWKGHVTPSVYHYPVSSLDVLATIADLTSASIDPNKPLDGVNLIPYVTGKKLGVPHKAIYLRKFDDQKFAVRVGDYKIITNFDGTDRQLYNLKQDISEDNNLVSALPERYKEIDTIRAMWNSELVDPVFKGLIHTPSWIKRMKKMKSVK